MAQRQALVLAEYKTTSRTARIAIVCHQKSSVYRAMYIFERIPLVLQGRFSFSSISVFRPCTTSIRQDGSSLNDIHRFKLILDAQNFSFFLHFDKQIFSVQFNLIQLRFVASFVRERVKERGRKNYSYFRSRKIDGSVTNFTFSPILEADPEDTCTRFNVPVL